MCGDVGSGVRLADGTPDCILSRYVLVRVSDYLNDFYQPGIWGNISVRLPQKKTQK